MPRPRYRSTVLGALALLLVVPGFGRAAPAYEQIIDMLSGYEWFPETQEWRSLGVAAVPILIEVANDPEQLMFRRARALVALGHFSEPAAVEQLAATASDESAASALRRAALLALSDADTPRGLEMCRRALAGPDALLREVAIKALRGMPDPEAARVLEDHWHREETPFLRSRIDHALRERNENGSR
jgi:hypothetical protein